MITQAQRESRERIIKQWGKKPIREYENLFLGVWFMEYPHITIGIEKDGHAHS